jgi:hypothetical protein
MGFHDIQPATKMLVPVFASLYENCERALSVMHMIGIGEVSSNHVEPIHASPEVTLVHRPFKDRKRSRPAAPGQVRRVAGRAEAPPERSQPHPDRPAVGQGRQREAGHQQQAVRPWWKIDPSGQVVMFIKFGAKLIEFEKGKGRHRRPVQGQASLGVIDALISAVRAGELHELFSQAAKTESIGKARKAADYANRVAGPARHPST